MEFTDHYTILEDRLFNTREAALAAANQDTERVWFVRHGDDNGIWDVQRDFGQFVNCAGFFVSIEPVKPEHVDEIFTY